MSDGAEQEGGFDSNLRWSIWTDQKISIIGRIMLMRRTERDLRADAAAMQEQPENLEGLIKSSLPKSSGFQMFDYERILKNQESYSYTYLEGNGSSPLNSVALWAGSAMAKVFLNLFSATTCFDSNKLLDHVLPGKRPPGRGLLTVANHVSVLDDPVLTAALTPWWIAFRPSVVRWGTCASDVCFKGKFKEQAMRALKVLPVVRFRGLNQDWMSQLVHRLDRGEWVSYYAEGRVSQGYIDRMRRGVGKIIVEANRNPEGLTVIPLYHEGLQNAMPQTEKNQLAYTFPRVGNQIWIIVGDPIDFRDIFEKAKFCIGSACYPHYEEAAQRVEIAIHLLRADLRKRAARDYGIYLGEPYAEYEDPHTKEIPKTA